MNKEIELTKEDRLVILKEEYKTLNRLRTTMMQLSNEHFYTPCSVCVEFKKIMSIENYRDDCLHCPAIIRCKRYVHNIKQRIENASEECDRMIRIILDEIDLLEEE